MATTGRTGRRPGNSGSREAILDAARELFAERGYEAASIRAIAGEAAVDPGLVMHFFGNKEGVFVAAMQLPYRPSEVLPGVLAGPPDQVGERAARFFVTVWDDVASRGSFIAMLRSAMSNEDIADLLRRFLERELLSILAGSLDSPDAGLRAALAGSQMIGFATARYIVRVEPLASAAAEEVIPLLGATLQVALAPAGQAR